MAEEQAQSFEERTIQRLEQELSKPESDGSTVEQEDTDEGIPSEAAESEDEAEGALSDSETDEESEDTDDGTPDEESDDVTDWETRYKDAQSELTKYQQGREQDANEHAEAMAEVIETRYALQDRIKEQEQQGSF